LKPGTTEGFLLKMKCIMEDDFVKRYPECNRACVVCGKGFNTKFLGSSRRVTCSRACARTYALRLQRENTKRYIKSAKYLAYRQEYYEIVKQRRRSAARENDKQETMES